MKNKMIDVILVIIMAATAIGASVAIYQTATSSVQEAPQIGGYPAEYGYPVATPTNDITLPGYPVMPTPYKIPTGQPTPKDFTPAPKMTPTEPVPTKDMEI